MNRQEAKVLRSAIADLVTTTTTTAATLTVREVFECLAANGHVEDTKTGLQQVRSQIKNHPPFADKITKREMNFDSPSAEDILETARALPKPMTVVEVFNRLVLSGKTPADNNASVRDRVRHMKRCGILPAEWFRDGRVSMERAELKSQLPKIIAELRPINAPRSLLPAC
jgi:hypothetical protein